MEPNVIDGVVSGIGTLFSLDHKLYASAYDSDSDSVASENQPYAALWRRHVCVPFRGTDMAAGNQQKHLFLSFPTYA